MAAPTSQAVRLAVAAMLLLIGVAGCLEEYEPFAAPIEDPNFELEQWARFKEDYLKAAHWPGLDVEIRIHAMDGYAPSQRTRDALLEQFSAAIPEKTIHLTDAPIPGETDSNHRWTLTELRNNANQWSAEPWPPGRAVVHLGYMDGCVAYSDERPCIGGVSMGEVAYVMLDQMRMFSESDPQFRPAPLIPSEDERWLSVHELGHSFGLVNSGVDPVVERSSEDCRCHSDRDDSVMSGTGAAGETRIRIGNSTALLESITGDRLEIYYFSAEDLEDLHAFQAKGREAIALGFWDPQEYHATRA